MRKYLAAIVITAMMLTAGCALAMVQSHRHTDRSDTNAIDSIVTSAVQEAQNDIDSAIDEFTDEFGNIDHNYVFADGNREGFLNETARNGMLLAFGIIAIMFLAPVLILAVILFFVYKNKQQKNKLAMAAIEKGISPETVMNHTNSSMNAYDKQQQLNGYKKTGNAETMEKGIMKVVISIGLYCVAKIMHINIVTAIALFVAVYGIGQIVIAMFVNKKKDDEKPE